MNKENYPIFKIFMTEEEAIDLQNFLQQNAISGFVIENKPTIDITFANNAILNSFEAHINIGDFDKAEELIRNQAKEMIQDVDEKHYLFDFTDEELQEILIKPDEWSSYDYLLAQDILSQRGANIEIDEIKSKQKARLEELKEPEKSKKLWIVMGYIFALLGGVIGIIIGYSLWQSKKLLPDGHAIYVYSENDRKQGEYIFYIGIIAIIVFIILRFING